MNMMLNFREIFEDLVAGRHLLIAVGAGVGELSTTADSVTTPTEILRNGSIEWQAVCLF